MHMAKRYWLEPAGAVITALGGCAKTAEILGMNRITVWRWTQPKRRGGTDGLIPRHEIQERILDWSRQNGDPVTAEMFFVPVSKAA